MKILASASYKDCDLAYRKNFSTSSCILPISVGQKVHEGEKLEAALKLISRTFYNVTILIDDTIQWHTMKILNPILTNAELMNEAKVLGDKWIERNSTTIQREIPEATVLRWDDFKIQKQYIRYKKEINETYQNNEFYNSQINLTITEFINRMISHGHNVEKKLAFKCCLEYLKEECACMRIWADSGYNFEVYPTGRNNAMKATHKLFIAPLSDKLLISVALRYKKKKVVSKACY